MDIIPDAVNQMDLPSEIGSEAARAAVADLIVGFAAGPVAFQTEALDATFSPFVDMFVKQEGSWWWTSNSDENGSSPWAADAQPGWPNRCLLASIRGRCRTSSICSRMR